MAMRRGCESPEVIDGKYTQKPREKQRNRLLPFAPDTILQHAL